MKVSGNKMDSKLVIYVEKLYSDFKDIDHELSKTS
jgi:hypothetical protein